MQTRVRTALAGRYVLERELGHGAMAEVYLARDLRHGRRVALKVLQPAQGTASGAARFLREIRTTARLSHPNILPLLDSGEADGLIYYTMPVVEGESLRARLDREEQLPIEVAIHVTDQVAKALVYAHGAGIVHRDIKPDNILIGPQDHVWVVDFGLARALAAGTEHRLSSAGIAVGSPYYMSPEQAAGDSDIDGRSDIYSLGCMTFEMIAGEPPFSGGTVASMLTRHLAEPPPLLSSRCRDVPVHLDEALQCALAKNRNARYADASTFADALRGVHVETPVVSDTRAPLRSSRLRGGLLATAALAAVAIAAWTLVPDLFSVLPAAAAPGDTSAYAIMPVSLPAGAVPAQEDQLLREAFARWRGVEVVDGLSIVDGVLREGGGNPGLRVARRIAQDLNAGRVVLSRVSTIGDSTVLYAAMYDSRRSGRAPATHTLRIPASERLTDRHFAIVADALLFRGAATPNDSLPGTRSTAALLAYAAGQKAIEEWDLAGAESHFRVATENDPQYARAFVWLAQVRFWMQPGAGSARQAASRAAQLRSNLSPRDELLLAALEAMYAGDFPRACQHYGTLQQQNPGDFTATLGLGHCHRFDPVVLRDPSSPTGWSFRGSGWRALMYHRRAFELVPATHRAFRGGRFLMLREDVFFTAPSAHRDGRDEAGNAFRAGPSWSDTLEFHPVPAEEFAFGGGASPTAVLAVTNLRQIFLAVTSTWVSAYPDSPDALEAHAIAMEMVGDTRALEAIRRARTLSQDPDQRLNLGISEFWLVLKRALPGSVRDITIARMLADTLISTSTGLTEHSAARLAAVAAVTGRAHRAAALARIAAQRESLPYGVAEAGAALLAYAAVGGPSDSIAALERQTERAIANLVPREGADGARAELLGRAAALAFGVHRMAIVDAAISDDDYMLEALRSAERGDLAGVHAALLPIDSARKATIRPADMKLEGLVPEARLFLQLGDAATALSWLGPTLEVIRYLEPGGLESVAAAGPLARALLLRAEIAHALGDSSGSREWASAFQALWQSADPELAEMNERARRLLAQEGRP